MSKSVRVETYRYEASHCHSPRGRGLWLFSDKEGNVLCEFNDSYSGAKASAQAWAQARKVPVIYVCS